MAGISSKAANGLENKKKYNGIEFENDLDISVYDAFYRELDPQIGRFIEIDPKTEDMYLWSPYASNFDNPIKYSDPLGDEGEVCCKELKDAAVWLGGKIDDLGNSTPVVWINNNINPVTPLAEFLTGKSLNSSFTENKPRIESGTQLGTFLVPTAKVETIIANEVKNVIVKQVEKQIVKTATGTKITGFATHAVNRAIERSVKPASILDAIKNPLKTGNVVVDNLGRPSQRYVGAKAEVVVNPEIGKIISVNPTSTKKAAKLIKKAGGE